MDFCSIVFPSDGTAVCRRVYLNGLIRCCNANFPYRVNRKTIAWWLPCWFETTSGRTCALFIGRVWDRYERAVSKKFCSNTRKSKPWQLQVQELAILRCFRAVLLWSILYLQIEILETSAKETLERGQMWFWYWNDIEDTERQPGQCCVFYCTRFPSLGKVKDETLTDDSTCQQWFLQEMISLIFLCGGYILGCIFSRMNFVSLFRNVDGC